jgi:tetratricopeptide (TPR) repeat protein
MTQEQQPRGSMASSIAPLRRLLSRLGIPASGRSPPTENGPSEQAISADPLWHEAHRHAHAGNHAAAEAAFRQLLAASPDHPGAGVALGQLLSHLGRHDEAIEGFIAVLERDRGNTDAWIGFTHLLSAARVAVAPPTEEITKHDAPDPRVDAKDQYLEWTARVFRRAETRG